MGDSGALLLGLLMAVSTSVVGGRAEPSQEFIGQTYFFLAPLVIPLLILGVPILDTGLRHRPPRRPTPGVDVADKGHLHHRLMNLGHGHRRSVLILWAWTALLSGFVLYPVLTGREPDLPAVRHGRHRHRACSPSCTRACVSAGATTARSSGSRALVLASRWCAV